MCTQAPVPRAAFLGISAGPCGRAVLPSTPGPLHILHPRLLDAVRHDGDWEAWIAFFLRGVEQTANGAVSTARQLAAVSSADRELVQGQGRRAGSALRVCEALTSRPVLTLSGAAQRTGLSFPGASDGMKLLGELGIVRELTGKKRNRAFAYDRYLALLGEGT